MKRYPLYLSLPYHSVVHYLQPLKQVTQRCVFHSNESGQGLSQYSFIAWEVAETFILADLQEAADFFKTLTQKQSQYTLDKVRHLPPFQGGLAGVLSYDLGRYTEPFVTQFEHTGAPLAWVNLYTMVLAFDHRQQQVFLIATGWPANDEALRLKNATASLTHWKAILTAPSETKTIFQQPLHFSPQIDEANYIEKIKLAQQAILSGEIFEVNLANCFIAPQPEDFDPFDLYLLLQNTLKEDFGGFFSEDDFAILSFSPERFLKITAGCLEARPIKGTCQRKSDKEEDTLAANTLQQSVKDRAENVMIVDLLRNDFSKVAEDDSVQVTQLCGLESKVLVHHLVSVIEGKLKKAYSIWDAVLALFPAGSITGAPKRQSMKVIDRLEASTRGFYCGHLFYASHSGDFDSSILIRSLFIDKKSVRCYGGGAITLLSEPKAEWEEITAKVLRFMQ